MLNQDFKEFLKLLNDRGVRYLVVGGYAVAFHGYPRFTGDMDVWIDATEDNAKRLVRVLKDFGFSSLELRREDFLEPDQIIQLGYPPCRIDILTSLPGVDFSFCYERRVVAEIQGVKVDFVDLECLKRSKKASGRAQDLADLEHLDLD